MSNGVRQMPGHVEAAYKEVVNNIFYQKTAVGDNQLHPTCLRGYFYSLSKILYTN